MSNPNDPGPASYRWVHGQVDLEFIQARSREEEQRLVWVKWGHLAPIFARRKEFREEWDALDEEARSGKFPAAQLLYRQWAFLNRVAYEAGVTNPKEIPFIDANAEDATAEDALLLPGEGVS